MTEHIEHKVNHVYPADRPWKRANILELSNDDLDAWLEGIRARRIKYAAELDEILKIKRETRIDELRRQLEKQLEMLDKAFVTLDKQLEKVEGRILKCHALNLELGEM